MNTGRVVGGGVGVVLIGGGILTFWGGLSGNLAAILAALFAPNQLIPTPGSSSKSAPVVPPPKATDQTTGPGPTDSVSPQNISPAEAEAAGIPEGVTPSSAPAEITPLVPKTPTPGLPEKIAAAVGVGLGAIWKFIGIGGGAGAPPDIIPVP